MSQQFNVKDLLSNDFSCEKNSTQQINLIKLNDFKNFLIYVYGYGRGFITLKTFLLDKYSLNIEGVFDKKFCTTLLNDDNQNYKLLNPLEFKLTNIENSIAIISTGNLSYQNEIKKNLRDIGFNKIVTAFEIYEYHLSHESIEFSQQPYYYLNKAKDRINSAFKLLTDEKSRLIFCQLLKIYSGEKSSLMSCDPIVEQYFPKDVPLSKGLKKFINCGSFDGDTVRQLVDLHGPISTLACFEPDNSNFNKLTKYLYENSNSIADQIIAFPCGVYNVNTQLRFSAGNMVNSSITDTGESVIQCVSIDEALPNFFPTYINMDIEGSELDAIQGAILTIKKYKPDLGICVYHKPDHLWNTILVLHEFVGTYKFYLRNYTGYPAETVLYCTH